MKVSDYIAKRLKEHYSVEHFFMVSGGGAMHLNDSLGRIISYIANHHEQACAMAAEGYSRVNQKLAVVNVTTGPGGLNCLNGVFGQWTDSVPVLYISGQVKFSTTIASCPKLPLRQLGDQEVDIISVVKPLTKYAKMVTVPNEIKYHIDKAIYESTTGRFGPVWLDIPIDVQASMIEESELIDFIYPKEIKYDFKMDLVIEKLNQAKRPLIIAGHGIRLSKQTQVFRKFIEKSRIPVVTTFNGFDLLEDSHPNYVGRIGTIGQRAGNFALQNADMILCLGTRNNIRQASYNYENFAKNAAKVVVDVDEAELLKPTIKADLAVNADLASFLPMLQEAINISSVEKKWLDYCFMVKEKFSFENYKVGYLSSGSKIEPYHLVNELSKLMDENTVVVMANGSACVCTFQTAVIKKGQRYILNSGNASMGYDLPASIGACLANGKKNTVCLAGDGSIMMNLQELQTIKHHNLPIKIFIINNDGYISIKQTQNNFFEGRIIGASMQSGVSTPDFVNVAKAFGIKSIRLSDKDKITETIKEILALDEPFLCEVVVNSDYIFVPKLSSRKLDDGTMVSPSLEDMYPFLDRAEYRRNMVGL
ncbi:MAG: thiamine pyrophosphate-binding protein [Candidatus Brocadiae bacterium]|nr:thiamine pyrophosphate-binding protein [Candidatus Brocadiia bacterium]